MSFFKDHKLLTCTLTGSLVVGGFLLWRRRNKNAIGMISKVEPSSVHVINSEVQWNVIYPTISEELGVCKVLGFDCEWVPLTNAKRPVSILQLATPSGLCVILQLLQLEDIPASLREILADKTILKAGVGCLGDAHKLMTDHALLVRGCIDLRHLAVRARLNVRSLGLKALTINVLGADLNKNLLVRAGNWELEPLTPEQVRYAAMDALVGVKIFLVLVNRKLRRPIEEHYRPIKEEKNWIRVVSMCQGIIDQRFVRDGHHEPYRNPVTSSTSSQPNPKAPDRASQAHRLRQKPLYHNCQLRAPDMQLISTCDLKKAEWYIEKGLGVKIGDEPLTVQLTFEPSGRPMNENNYYLQHKENNCVVCGQKDSYIRKNIVPHEYRKYFPTMLKEHRSHDVVLMCRTCHQRSGVYDSTIKDRLAQECDAPIGTTEETKFIPDQTLHKVKSAAKALLKNSGSIPALRITEMEEIICLHYGVDRLTDDILHQAKDIDTKFFNSSYVPHGKKVAQYYIEHDGLIEFERMWRQHFLDTMKPAYLPPLWSVDHSQEELAGYSRLRPMLDASH